MAEFIKLTYDEKDYELLYTRETVRQMESTGFDIQAFVKGTKPGTMNFMLFEGAFAARNRKIKRKTIAEIYDHLPDKADLILALAEMYAATLETLTDTAAEDTGKKATWEAI